MNIQAFLDEFTGWMMTVTDHLLPHTRIGMLVLILALAACTPATMHRPETVVEREDFTFTFIEFDDHGEPWVPTQQMLRRIGEGADEVALIGVYLSWRGRSTDVGLHRASTRSVGSGLVPAASPG